MTADNNNDDYLVQTIFLLLITVICLGVSWWSMATGYESFMGGFVLSAAVATVFVLMLAALNYTLRRGLIKGIGKGKIAAILIIYLMVVLLSFSGMFNKFYSKFMENDLIREEIDQKIDLLTQLEKDGMNVLTSEEANAVRTKVDALKKDLEREILSQTERGVGKKAKSILAEVQELLGKTSPFPVPPTPTLSNKELETVIARLKSDIDSEVEKSDKLRAMHSPEKYALSLGLPKTIKTAKGKLAEARSNLGKGSGETQRSDGLIAIQSAVDVYKETAKEIESIVKEKPFTYQTDVRVINDRVGEIPHTYESAKAHIDRGVVWISALIALGIDLIVPIFVFFLTPRSGVSSSTSFRRGSRGAGGLSAEH